MPFFRQVNSQDNFKARNNHLNPILRFFRLLGVFSIIFVLLISVVAVFVLTSPKNQLSQILVGQTFLKNYITLPQTNISLNSDSTQVIEQKLINNIIGTTNQNNNKFFFASPSESLTVTQAVEKVLPSVLSISTKKDQVSEKLNQSDTSSGSAYIVTKTGLVVTNKHVISEFCSPNSNIDQVQFVGLSFDQKIYDLELLSVDPVDDIAILQIKNLKTEVLPVTFGDSSKIKLGQDVIAIGNALGELQNTITKGIVSGLDRNFETKLVDNCSQNKFKANGLIQTDAAINKGNSGGPLFNASGHFIGMNTLSTEDSENIGFAVPSLVIQRVLNIFTAKNKIFRSNLNLDYVLINSALKSQNPWLPFEKGLIVFDQNKDGFFADDQTGLKEYDLITEINGQEITENSYNSDPVKNIIMQIDPSSKIKIKVWKAKILNKGVYEYEKEPQVLEISLGLSSFNLKTKQIEYQK